MILEFWIVFNIHFHSYAYFRWILNLKSKSFHTISINVLHMHVLSDVHKKRIPKIPNNQELWRIQNWFPFPNECVLRFTSNACAVSSIDIRFKNKQIKNTLTSQNMYNISSLNFVPFNQTICVADVVQLFDFDWIAHGRSAVMTHTKHTKLYVGSLSFIVTLSQVKMVKINVTINYFGCSWINDDLNRYVFFFLRCCCCYWIKNS